MRHWEGRQVFRFSWAIAALTAAISLPRQGRAQEQPKLELADPTAPSSQNRNDYDSWFTQFVQSEKDRKEESKRRSAESARQTEEEGRRWFLGLGGGYGTAAGGRGFRANYVSMDLQVVRYAEPLGSSGNFFLGIELPTRRYSELKESAWATGMLMTFGIEESWIVGGLGFGGGMMPGAAGKAIGGQAKVGIRLWRMVLGGEARSWCGDSGQGALYCIGEIGGMLSVDLVRPFTGAR